MEIIIWKNNNIVKSFRKFFACFLLEEMEDWTKEKFPKANIGIDLRNKIIHIRY